MTIDVDRPRLSVSPRLGVLLAEVGDTPDIEAALVKVLREYLDMKITALEARVHSFEAKWGMPFEAFVAARRGETLEPDPYSYAVESNFWEWEEASTLCDHYRDLRGQWM